MGEGTLKDFSDCFLENEPDELKEINETEINSIFIVIVPRLAEKFCQFQSYY